MADVIVNGEEIGSVRDRCEPEDAIWHRDLEDIFWTGVNAGLKAESLGDVAVINIRYD